MNKELEKDKRDEIILKLTKLASLGTAVMSPVAGLASAVGLTFIKKPFERRLETWMKDVSDHPASHVGHDW